jgi:hypothetical protein
MTLSPNEEDYEINTQIRTKHKKKNVKFRNDADIRYYDDKAIISNDRYYDDKVDVYDPDLSETAAALSDTDSDIEFDIADETNSYDYDKIKTHNSVNVSNNWDDSFGIPLMSKDEKRNFAQKMQKNHKQYTKSMGKIDKFVNDKSNVIMSTPQVDPHISDKQLLGKSVSEIYDSQVTSVKAVPMKIKKLASGQIVYENENENNGGKLQDSNLYGYDSKGSTYKLSTFGDEF